MTECHIDKYDDLAYCVIEVTKMADYKKLYFLLARRLADAVDLLVMAQREAEELYMEENEAPIIEISPLKEE